MGEAPDPELTSRMQKPCMKSPHPTVHICKKKPETDFARKVHREIKGLSKRLEKKEIRRKKGKEGGHSRKNPRSSWGPHKRNDRIKQRKKFNGMKKFKGMKKSRKRKRRQRRKGF